MVIARPLTSPIRIPIPNPIRITRMNGLPCLAKVAATTAESAIVEPTERSMPPDSMT